jgi:Mg2+ and Co2+ transporter CorA
MTRLQNAKNQLIEALAALESASSQINTAANKANSVASPSQKGAQAVVCADLSALVDEVSIIEAKLSQAMTMIASVESGAVTPQTTNDGDTQ